MTEQTKSPKSFWQIWNMCFGFLGIQLGMGLQLSNMSPIYRYLGAEEGNIPFLWLAGPITGLFIQPIIGAMSDNTWNRWGRRRPYFMAGAIVASICLVLMPNSSAIWMAAGLMWILDAACNTSMEPARAFVGDLLPKEQQAKGYSVQALLIGIGQLFSSLLPFAMVAWGLSTKTEVGQKIPDFVKYSFILGALVILASVYWTFHTTKEYPPADMDAFRAKQRKGTNFFAEIIEAIRTMPLEMRQMWWIKFFCWYSLPFVWEYFNLAVARHIYNAPNTTDAGFAEGVSMGSLSMAFYCVATIVMGFIFPKWIKSIGTRKVTAICFLIGTVGFMGLQLATTIEHVFVLCFLMGIGFAALCTMPFIMLSSIFPQEKMGVYMGLLNAFICVPQILGMITLPFYYNTILNHDPRNAVFVTGICHIFAALAALRMSKTVDNKA